MQWKIVCISHIVTRVYISDKMYMSAKIPTKIMLGSVSHETLTFV